MLLLKMSVLCELPQSGGEREGQGHVHNKALLKIIILKAVILLVNEHTYII